MDPTSTTAYCAPARDASTHVRQGTCQFHAANGPNGFAARRGATTAWVAGECGCDVRTVARRARPARRPRSPSSCHIPRLAVGSSTIARPTNPLAIGELGCPGCPEPSLPRQTFEAALS